MEDYYDEQAQAAQRKSQRTPFFVCFCIQYYKFRCRLNALLRVKIKHQPVLKIVACLLREIHLRNGAIILQWHSIDVTRIFDISF